MPCLSDTFSAKVFRSASALPATFWEAATANPAHFNTILPTAQKCCSYERAGNAPYPNHVWIMLSTHTPQPRLDLVLACTSTEMGAYPIFISSACSESTSHLTHEFLGPRLSLLAKALLQAVPPRRVYSIFGPKSITEMFVRLWSNATGIRSYTEPYYAAKLSVCTAKTLKNRNSTLIPGLETDLRLAVPSDLEGVAESCYGFAADSDPFTLTWEKAVKEATLLIEKAAVWVYSVRTEGDGAPNDIASIVACTRNSDTVATITKVYTNPKWRRQGCAERLVRRVTKTLLSGKFEKVALFVAHDNPAASHVYHKVGFSGLEGNAQEGVNFESWSEIGFDRGMVELGHW